MMRGCVVAIEINKVGIRREWQLSCGRWKLSTCLHEPPPEADELHRFSSASGGGSCKQVESFHRPQDNCHSLRIPTLLISIATTQPRIIRSPHEHRGELW